MILMLKKNKMRYAILTHNKDSFEQKTVTIKLLCLAVLISVFFTGTGFTIGSLTNHPNIMEKTVYSDRFLESEYSTPFSEKALKEFLVSLHVKHIDIVMTQAKIESSHFKSKVFIENKNLFGMKLAKNRVTTATGENLNHATYNTWKDSALDYSLWQTAFLKNATQEEYLAYLNANYAENKAYVSLITKMKQ